jgi:hypothetical protein
VQEVLDVWSFLKAVGTKQFVEERGRWIFRGHADKSFKLLPSIGRETHTSRDRAQYEQSLFTIFCREARAYVEILPDNPWDWLSLAQHHGLPTRLLDWTSTHSWLCILQSKQSRSQTAMFSLSKPRAGSVQSCSMARHSK